MLQKFLNSLWFIVAILLFLLFICVCTSHASTFTTPIKINAQVLSYVKVTNIDEPNLIITDTDVKNGYVDYVVQYQVQSNLRNYNVNCQMVFDFAVITINGKSTNISNGAGTIIVSNSVIGKPVTVNMNVHFFLKPNVVPGTYHPISVSFGGL